MLNAKKNEFWFCTGSQDLYGDECLAHVAEHSWIIVDELNRSGNLPFEVVLKPTLIKMCIRDRFYTVRGGNPRADGRKRRGQVHADQGAHRRL